MSEPPITRRHHGGVSHGSNGNISLVVIHDEEYPLDDDSAEAIARYFADPKHGNSCAHYVEDSDSEQHCVPDNQIAYHAPPNKGSIGIERDGYASWTKEQWLQPKAQLTTCRVAARTAELCVRHHLPPIWLGPAEVKAKKKGVTSHANKSKAFSQSDHTDPGPAFPVNPFMALVKQAYTIFANPLMLKQFQSESGLAPDGDAGKLTVSAMARHLFDGGAVIQPNKSAPAKPVAKPKPPTPEKPAVVVINDKEIDVDFRVLYRTPDSPAAFALTGDGHRVWVDGPWYKALQSLKLVGPIVEVPAESSVFSLPVLGMQPPVS